MFCWTDLCIVFSLMFFRRFSRIAQEDNEVRKLPISLAFILKVKVIIICYWLYNCFWSSIGFQLAARVPWILPCRVEFVGLWMCKIFTICGCCFCYLSFKIHNSTKETPLGMSFFFHDILWCWFLSIVGKYLLIFYVLQSSSMQQYSGYKASDLKECVLIIHDLYLNRRGGALQAVREKYKQHKVCTCNTRHWYDSNLYFHVVRVIILLK